MAKHNTNGQCPSRALGIILPVLLVLSVLGFSLSCAKSDSGQAQQFQIPWPNANGDYHLTRISIPTFTQPQTLQGDSVKIFVNPHLRENELAGETPVGRFVRTKDGVLVPSNYVSLQATAVHAHFERLSGIDQQLGLQLAWPLKVGIQSNVRDQEGVILDNAIYDSRLDALLVVPFTGSNLPIVVNGGILAHEHFHMVFQNLVIRKLKFKDLRSKIGEIASLRGHWHDLASVGSVNESEQKPKKNQGPEKFPTEGGELSKAEAADLYNIFYLRALNEGLADFWAWVYTGDPDFISHSLPSEKHSRTLNLHPEGLPAAASIKAKVFSVVSKSAAHKSLLVGMAYRLGTEYARGLRELAMRMDGSDQGRSLDSRLKIARLLVEALPDLQSAYADAGEKNQMVSGNELLRLLYQRWPGKEGQICRTFQRLAAPDPDSFAEKLNCPKPEMQQPDQVSTHSTVSQKTGGD